MPTWYYTPLPSIQSTLCASQKAWRILIQQASKKSSKGEGASSARVKDRSVEGKAEVSEAEIAEAVASGGFKGEVCL